VAHFEHSASALPLHPVLAAEWFRAAAAAIPSIGSGGTLRDLSVECSAREKVLAQTCFAMSRTCPEEAGLR